MTPAQFKSIIARLDLSNSDAAKFLSIDIRQHFRYLAGQTPIPEVTAKLLRLMVKLKLTPEDVD